MNFRTGLLITALALVSVLAFSKGSPLYAQDNADASRAYKVGVVDLQRVMDNYNKCKTEVEKLDAQVNERKKGLDALEAKFKSAAEEFAKERDSMPEEERAKREEQMDTDALSIQIELRKAQATLEGEQRRLKQSLIKDVMQVVEEIGAAENYHLILETDPETRTGVLYSSPTLNMTQKVIDKLNSGK